MGDLTIVTNGAPRDVLSWFDLTPKEQADFDYLATEERKLEASFMRYRGEAYDLGEFMRVDGQAFPSHWPHAGWDGVQSDTYFSGVLIRYVDNFERVIAGRYYS